MFRRLFCAIATLAFSPFAVHAASTVNVVFDTENQLITFDFTGMGDGEYFQSGGNATQTYLSMGTDFGAFTGDLLVSNDLIDRFGDAVNSDSVDQIIRQYEGADDENPLTALGIGSYGGAEELFTVGGGTITYNMGVFFPGASNPDYYENFPFTATTLGTFVGTGGFTMTATQVPEPSSYALWASCGIMALCLFRRRR